jgi:hypothetical protein
MWKSVEKLKSRIPSLETRGRGTRRKKAGLKSGVYIREEKGTGLKTGHYR